MCVEALYDRRTTRRAEERAICVEKERTSQVQEQRDAARSTCASFRERTRRTHRLDVDRREEVLKDGRHELELLVLAAETRQDEERRLGELAPDSPRTPRHAQDVGGERVAQDLEVERRAARKADQAEVDGGRALEEGTLGALLGRLADAGGRLGGRVGDVGRRGLRDDEEVGDAERARHRDVVAEPVGLALLQDGRVGRVSRSLTA